MNNMPEHRVTLIWKRGGAEFSYQKYPRDHTWIFDGGHTMTATAAPAYLGSPANVDPEDGRPPGWSRRKGDLPRDSPGGLVTRSKEEADTELDGRCFIVRDANGHVGPPKVPDFTGVKTPLKRARASAFPVAEVPRLL